MSAIDEIKDKVNILELARDLGFEVKNMKALCCFHSEQEPSLTFYPESNSFYCFGCGIGGSVIHFYMYFKKCDYWTAARELARMYNIPWEESEPSEARQQREQEEERQDRVWQAVNYWQKNLRSEDKAHLQERGLSPGFIEKMRIGYEPRKTPQDIEAARKMGLVSEKGYYLPAKSIIIPFTLYGKISLLVFYRPGQKPKYFYPAGWEKQLIGADIISRTQEIYLTEGVFDYLSLLQAGFPAVCSFGTMLNDSQKQQLARAKRVFVAFDGDGPGRNAALQICKEFFPAARMLELPDEKDINDLLIENADNFEKRIGELRTASKDILEIELETIKDLPEWEKSEAVTQRIIPLVAKLDRTSQENFFDKNKKELGIKTARAFRAAINEQRNFEALKENQDTVQEGISKEEKEEAEVLLNSPEILDRFIKITERIGHVGENTNKKYLYLAMTSRLLDRPISTVAKGESSAGKSYLVETVAAFFPADEIYQFTRLTANVLYYTKKSFSHKMLIIMERAGSEDSDYSIRSFISEGKLRISCTVKNPETGEFYEMDKEVPGPIGYIETTTKPAIHNENETRVFDIFIDESESQTRRILDAERKRATGGGMTEKEKEYILRPFINAQKLLKPYKVIIPYADKITFPTNKVRIRRDFKRFLALIEASAILHQRQRKFEDRNGETYLLADIKDYTIAYDLAQKILIQTLKNISPAGERMAKVAEELFSKKGDDDKALTRREFYDALPETGKSSIDRCLYELVKTGVLEQEGGGKGRGNRIKYYPLKSLSKIDLLIPSPEEIEAQAGTIENENLTKMLV